MSKILFLEQVKGVLFQIPMRGYEIKNLKPNNPRLIVPNPHEGL